MQTVSNLLKIFLNQFLLMTSYYIYLSILQLSCVASFNLQTMDIWSQDYGCVTVLYNPNTAVITATNWMDHPGDVVRAMARGQETNQFVNVRTQSIDNTEVRLLVSAFDVS
jgi:hypothetical protein